MRGRNKNARRTVSRSQLVKSRSWYDFVIDMRAVCGLKVNDEWPCKDVKGMNKPMQERTNLITGFVPPNSSFSCTWRSEIQRPPVNKREKKYSVVTHVE